MRNETSQGQENDEKTHNEEKVVMEKVFKYRPLFFS